MHISTLSFVVSAAALLTLGARHPAPTAMAPPCMEELPADVRAPDGNELGFALAADGVQVYTCAASGASYAWAFKAPDATLSEVTGGAAGTHGAGPTWRSTDGSSVVGEKVGSTTPDPAAIPWLLLRASSHEGGGRMADVTYVARIRTSGGNAPAKGCDKAHAGAVARVPYQAVYCFYRKASDKPAQ